MVHSDTHHHTCHLTLGRNPGMTWHQFEEYDAHLVVLRLSLWSCLVQDGARQSHRLNSITVPFSNLGHALWPPASRRSKPVNI
jgi:hypothetical protein